MFSHEQIIAFERFLYHVFRFLVIFLLCIFGFRFFVVSPGVVNGPSMEPNYKDDKIFFVNRFLYLFHTPERKDIVQIIDPRAKKLIIKRIVGLPGDTVMIKRGKVFLREPGKEEYELDESSYLKGDGYTDVPNGSEIRAFTLGAHEYFLLGDNRRVSVDSRYYGSVSRSYIIGKVIN